MRQNSPTGGADPDVVTRRVSQLLKLTHVPDPPVSELDVELPLDLMADIDATREVLKRLHRPS